MDSTEGGYQGGSSGQAVGKDFWETFGSNNSLKATNKKSPSSDSWTNVDNNSAKKSSDSWDNWGSEAASNNKNSEDSWEAWDSNWENSEGKGKKSPSKPVEESWENADW